MSGVMRACDFCRCDEITALVDAIGRNGSKRNWNSRQHPTYKVDVWSVTTTSPPGMVICSWLNIDC